MEVWAQNLDEEMARIRDVAEVFQHVAMDTQFPGIVARPTGPFNDWADYNYQMLKCNVDLTRVIQIGFTFSDARGNRPKGICTWRFNFGFNPSKDLYSQESIEAIRQTRAQDFPARHMQQGIDPLKFGELLMGSGLVLSEEIRWITFCSLDRFNERPTEDGGPGRPSDPPWVTFCGLYDFGHMLQLLTNQPLADEVPGFYEALDLFFPSRCDVAKHLHRIPQTNGEGRRQFLNAPLAMDAFFRLPEQTRRTAFDKAEVEEAPTAAAAQAPRGQRRRRDKEEPRSRAHPGPSGRNGPERG